MSLFEKKTIITAIDIGTSKVSILIGESSPTQCLSIIGYSEERSDTGFCKGELVDFSKARNALVKAVEKAERSAGTNIDEDNIYLSITGSHIKSQTGTGSVIINKTSDYKIEKKHLEQAMEHAKAISLPHDFLVFNIFDSQFIIDDNPDNIVTNPLGHHADKLTAIVHMIYGNRNKIRSLSGLFNEIGFNEPDPIPIFSGVASAYGLLSDDEQEYGSLVIDTGAGSTDYALVINRGICHSNMIPVGCEHIANDLSIGLDLNIQYCRKMIMDCNFIKEHQKDSMLEIKTAGKLRRIPIASIQKIIALRVEEIFDIIKTDLQDKNLLIKISSGVVLTGGITKVSNAIEFLKSVFRMPVRIGTPQNTKGTITSLNEPTFSTAWGLLKYGEKIHATKDHSTILSFADLIDNTYDKLIRMLKAGIDSIKL